MEYYFLLSSFPALNLETKSPIDFTYFLSACETQLSVVQFRLVRRMQDGMPLTKDYEEESLPPVLVRWNAYNVSLRAALALRRGDADASSDLIRYQTEQLAHSDALFVLEQETPLKREHAILTCQWQMLELLESGHYFDFTVVLIYALRLSLVRRRQSFKQDRGQEKFQTVQRDLLSIEDTISRFTQARR